MKKVLHIGMVSMTAVAALTAGGGKNMAPAVVPVVPIEIVSPVPFYIGIGMIANSISRDPCPCNPNGPDLKDHRYGAVARAGWDYNQYIGIEARALKTFGGDVFSKTEHYGLYLKPQYHIVDQMNVYGLIGYGRSKVNYTNGVRHCKEAANGLAYGIGVEYDFGAEEAEGTYDRAFDGQGDQEKGWGLWVDVQQIFHNEGATHTDLNLLTAGITYDF